MKKLLIVGLSIAAVYFLAPVNTVHATANICFCHTTPSEPFTNCTSNKGEQNGHFGHGDVPFGCECGDGICSPEAGEDCSTCPTDCTDDTACNLCGDGVIDEGEDCNEPGLTCVTGVCVGCRCLTTCGDGIVDPGEQCDGDSCCNDDCTLMDTPECTGGTDSGGTGSGSADSGGTGSGSADSGATDSGTTDGSNGHCEYVPQTGGNGQGCSRNFNEQCTASAPQDSRMLSFALLFLPPLALFPRLRSRRKKQV